MATGWVMDTNTRRYKGKLFLGNRYSLCFFIECIASDLTVYSSLPALIQRYIMLNCSQNRLWHPSERALVNTGRLTRPGTSPRIRHLNVSRLINTTKSIFNMS